MAVTRVLSQIKNKTHSLSRDDMQRGDGRLPPVLLPFATRDRSDPASISMLIWPLFIAIASAQTWYVILP